MRKLLPSDSECVFASPTDDNKCETCRLCGFLGPLESLGELPEMYRFAGTKLSVPLIGGGLVRCPNCSSMQRSPIFSESQYNTLYRSGTESVWAAAELRYDQHLALTMINGQNSVGSVLDVGCNTGIFLQAMPGHIKKYGIEPSVAAASVARKAGINIISDRIDNIGADQLFDCITFIDVIEHLPYPTDTLRIATQHLTKNGFIIISTGNPECKSWATFFQNKFWYSSFAEHISFPSKKYFKEILLDVGLRVEQYDVFRYSRDSWHKLFTKLILQFLYSVNPRFNSAMVWLKFREFPNPFSKKNAFLPCSGVFTDHHIVKLIKNSENTLIEF